MKVKLRYKTAETPKGKHKIIDCASVKEAEAKFKALEGVTKAWLTRFDTWKDVLKS